MSSRNRARREQNRETRIAAAEEHLRRTKRQRVVFAVGGLAFALIVALALVVKPWDGAGDSSASTTTTTGVPSAAGKPCVAVKDALPKGAPAVPVKVGPPPKELVKKDLKVGTGAEVTPGANVAVDYIGVACSTGTIFDASYFTGEPAALSLDQVVPGWKQGIPGMRVGGRRLLVVPPALAYGSQGSDSIAPDETLWFVVTVKDTQAPTTSTT